MQRSETAVSPVLSLFRSLAARRTGKIAEADRFLEAGREAIRQELGAGNVPWDRRVQLQLIQDEAEQQSTAGQKSAE